MKPIVTTKIGINNPKLAKINTLGLGFLLFPDMTYPFNII